MKKEYLGTREKHLEEREKKFLEAVSQLDRDVRGNYSNPQ